MTIQEILNSENSADVTISLLKEKTVFVPVWSGRNGLAQEYDPCKHPVMNKQKYPDEITEDGVEPVSRVVVDLQRLAAKRMTELCCGIPVRRIYKPENDRQKDIAKYLEKIFEKCRIDSFNYDRLHTLFSCCEVFTLWYAVEQPNYLYGFTSSLKMRCRNFSPMLGDDLYPLFDEYGDMIAMSIGYTRKVGKKNISFFDTYANDRHIKWSNANGAWEVVEDEPITLLKIPGIYMYRPTPIWEATSNMVYEIEWTLSRNGNYIRKNSKPLFIVFADDVIRYGDEKSENKEFKQVMQYPKGSNAQYVTWQQAQENIKFHTSEIRQWFFTLLQLPDWSYEKMSQQALSGESRKQLFIDAQMKVKDESGRLIEFFDREVNVVKAFLKIMLGDGYANDIDALPVEIEITPFSITDEKEQIDKLTTANGGKPVCSQRESIEALGWSTDVDKTLQEINEESKLDSFSLTE